MATGILAFATHHTVVPVYAFCLREIRIVSFDCRIASDWLVVSEYTSTDEPL